MWLSAHQKCPNRLVNGYAIFQPCVIPSFLLWKWDFPPQKVVSPSSHTLLAKIREGFTPSSSAKVFRQSGAAQMRHNMNRFCGTCARERAGQTRFFSRAHRQSHRRLHGNRPQSTSSRRLSSKVHRLRTPAAFRKRRVRAAYSANTPLCPFKTSVCFSAFRPKSVLYQKDRSLRHGGLRSFFDVCQRTSSSGSTHSLAR